MRVHKLPSRRYRGINPSSGSGSFMASRNAGALLRFMRAVRSLRSIAKLIKLTPAPESRKFAVWITVVVAPYEIQSLSVGLADRAKTGSFNWECERFQ